MNNTALLYFFSISQRTLSSTSFASFEAVFETKSIVVGCLQRLARPVLHLHVVQRHIELLGGGGAGAEQDHEEVLDLAEGDLGATEEEHGELTVFIKYFFSNWNMVFKQCLTPGLSGHFSPFSIPFLCRYLLCRKLM